MTQVLFDKKITQENKTKKRLQIVQRLSLAMGNHLTYQLFL